MSAFSDPKTYHEALHASAPRGINRAEFGAAHVLYAEILDESSRQLSSLSAERTAVCVASEVAGDDFAQITARQVARAARANEFYLSWCAELDVEPNPGSLEPVAS